MTILLCTAMIGGLSAASAAAASCKGLEAGGLGFQAQCQEAPTEGEPAVSPVGGGDQGPPPPQDIYIGDDVGTIVAGQCVQSGGGDATDAGIEAQYIQALGQYGLCPEGGPGDPGDGPTPGQLASILFANLDLPAPTPSIEVPYFITGLESWLLTGDGLDPLSTTQDGITIRTDSNYEIDWGDGTPVETYETDSTGYPDGSISHVFVDVTETQTVNVTQVFSGEWRLGNGPWTAFPFTRSTTADVSFEVQEVRSKILDSG